VAHFLARAVYVAWRKKPESIRQTKALRQLHAHLRHGYIPHAADSVQMIYLRNATPDSTDGRDVLFQFTYASF